MKTYLSALIKSVVKEVILEGESTLEISDKPESDVVTNKDIEVERRIKAALLEKFPKDRFIGEEEDFDADLSMVRTWVLDPIDGTLNYTKNTPYFGTQLALYENGVPTVGLIYLPMLDEFYFAEKGKGAFLNDIPLHADEHQTLDKSIVTFGDFSKSNPTSRPVQLEIMSNLMHKAMKIRIQGASSIDFAFVASGRSGAHVLFTKRLWEISAGLLLCLEAGCVTNVDMGVEAVTSGNGIIISQNSEMLNEIMKTFA